MKILVTGAAGFIGSHLTKRLEDEGHELKLIDDLSRGKQRYLDYLGVKTSCLRMDLRSLVGHKQICFRDIDEVYHCACRIGGNQYLHGSQMNELLALQDNLAIDRNVFNACLENNVKKIIYTSSVSVYNTTKQNGIEAIFAEEDLEKQKLEPEGGYGWSKFVGEKQLSWMKENGINTGVTRIFKSYGPCDDYSDESGQVVCSLMRKAINYPKEKYILWGVGDVTRCLVYIDDLIDGIMKLSKYCDKKSLTVNLGGKQPYTMRELAQKIKIIANKNGMDIENDMGKPTGVKSRIPVLSKARDRLNWCPTTSLETGLKKTYKWMEYDIAKS